MITPHLICISPAPLQSGSDGYGAVMASSLQAIGVTTATAKKVMEDRYRMVSVLAPEVCWIKTMDSNFGSNQRRTQEFFKAWASKGKYKISRTNVSITKRKYFFTIVLMQKH
jgi:hypothetical protein